MLSRRLPPVAPHLMALLGPSGPFWGCAWPIWASTERRIGKVEHRQAYLAGAAAVIATVVSIAAGWLRSHIA
jgi:hypothetical protein